MHLSSFYVCLIGSLGVYATFESLHHINDNSSNSYDSSKQSLDSNHQNFSVESPHTEMDTASREREHERDSSAGIGESGRLCITGEGKAGGGLANTLGFANALLDFALRHNYTFIIPTLSTTAHSDGYAREALSMLLGPAQWGASTAKKAHKSRSKLGPKGKLQARDAKLAQLQPQLHAEEAGNILGQIKTEEQNRVQASSFEKLINMSQNSSSMVFRNITCTPKSALRGRATKNSVGRCKLEDMQLYPVFTTYALRGSSTNDGNNYQDPKSDGAYVWRVLEIANKTDLDIHLRIKRIQNSAPFFLRSGSSLAQRLENLFSHPARSYAGDNHQNRLHSKRDYHLEWTNSPVNLSALVQQQDQLLGRCSIVIVIPFPRLLWHFDYARTAPYFRANYQRWLQVYTPNPTAGSWTSLWRSAIPNTSQGARVNSTRPLTVVLHFRYIPLLEVLF